MGGAGGDADHVGDVRRGHVDRSRVPTGLKKHELDAANRLADRGHDVVFVPHTGVGKTADLTLDGQVWELKSVFGASNDAIARNIRGADQAPRVVLDLTDSSIGDDVAKSLAEHYGKRYSMDRIRLIRGSDGLDWTYNRA